jgi:hypothetical protein
VSVPDGMNSRAVAMPSSISPRAVLRMSTTNFAAGLAECLERLLQLGRRVVGEVHPHVAVLALAIFDVSSGPAMRSRVSAVVRFGLIAAEHQQLDLVPAVPPRSRTPSNADMSRSV